MAHVGEGEDEVDEEVEEGDGEQLELDHVVLHVERGRANISAFSKVKF